MASITLERVSKVFPDGTVAVSDLDLRVEDGEFVILVGPSGSGKSTALRMIAGLEDSSSGEIRIGDRVVTDVEPKDRDLAMVFQSYALYPHMTVEANMGFALEDAEGAALSRSRSACGRRRDMLGVSDLLHRRPRALSGGQRQRVALGRAIVRKPAAFLMDEPLSNLDAKLRVEMRTYIGRLHHELRTTTVYVTHDQVEAMTMGDRVAVMRAGRIVQADVPQALYEHPADLFVAGFMGSPAMNLVRARVERGAGGGLEAVLGSQRLALTDAVLAQRPALAGYAGREVVIGIRPEAFQPTLERRRPPAGHARAPHRGARLRPARAPRPGCRARAHRRHAGNLGGAAGRGPHRPAPPGARPDHRADRPRRVRPRGRGAGAQHRSDPDPLLRSGQRAGHLGLSLGSD